MIGIVVRSEPIRWMSYARIVANLRAAYELAFPGRELRVFEYPAAGGRAALWRMAEEIRSSKIKRLAFVDQALPQFALLHALGVAFRSKPLPELVFHLDGDFTHRLREWQSVETPLKSARVLFACGSERHARLVRSFLRAGESATRVLPFPVDTRAFCVDPHARRRGRQRLGLKAGERLALYSGRVSSQKNVLPLLELVSRVRGLQLAVVGPSDFMGENYFARERLFGALEREVALRGSTAQVHRIPWASTRELADFYNAADAFVSLSLYHDEDFGMAPAEALSCGASAILTDWGGFAGFGEVDASSCRYVGVKLGSSGARFDAAAALRALREIRPSSDDVRRQRSDALAAACSLRSVARQLIALHETTRLSEFRGFSPRVRELVFLFDPERGVFHSGSRSNKLYQEVYSAYVGR